MNDNDNKLKGSVQFKKCIPYLMIKKKYNNCSAQYKLSHCI